MGSGRCALEDLVSAVLDFFKDKRVLVTGHTGFKGSWLSWMLLDAGAQVTGYALDAPTEPSLFELSGLAKRQGMDSRIADIRDFDTLLDTFHEVHPQIVFHLAAQPIVRDSYDDPRYTYETNVMGTVNVLECVRMVPGVECVVNVTTDKVYLNPERADYAFVEDDMLDGFDPYSNSKSCSELVTHSYARSFLDAAGIPVSTARAGNVIGGGDFAAHRIVPDCVRATLAGERIVVRNPHSVRPFQHVLEPLWAYATIAARQAEDPELAGWYNIGPDTCDCISAGQIAQAWCDAWGEGASWTTSGTGEPEGDPKHEAGFLRLSNEKIKRTFGWQPRWDVREAIERTAQWTRVWADGGDIGACLSAQIADFQHAG